MAASGMLMPSRGVPPAASITRSLVQAGRSRWRDGRISSIRISISITPHPRERLKKSMVRLMASLRKSPKITPCLPPS